ncbi:MAG TPA: TonB family protein [Pyrinomonadaceae bacterium]|jgi:TonB family protein
MKKIFLFSVLFFTAPLFVLAQNPDLQEANRLAKEAGQLFAAQKFDEAIASGLKELALRDRIGDEQALAVAHFNLAAIYGESKHLPEAAEHLRAALPLYRKKTGEASLQVYSVLTSLARIAYAQRDLTTAAEYLKSALPVAEKLYGAEHEQTAKAHINLAAVFDKLGRDAEAETYFQRAIQINDGLVERAKAGVAIRKDIYQYQCFAAGSLTPGIKERMNDFFENRQRLKDESHLNVGVINSKAKKLVQPEYPKAALAARAGGRVTVRVVVSESGDVVHAELNCGVNGHPLLRNAALEAARKSKFTPFQASGQNNAVSGIIIYNFSP